MTTINLLPWREKARNQQKRDFILACVAAIGIVLFIDITCSIILQAKISGQHARNLILQQEIQQADAVIKKKNALQAEKQNLLDQMTTLKELNNQRYRLVELINVLPKILPEGTNILSLQAQKNLIELRGVAPTDLQSSEFVKKLHQQPGWTNVQLLEIQSQTNSQFRITFNME